MEEAQRHQSSSLTDQTLWERNANLCCDKADLLFCSRGIVPTGGAKRGEGELGMMGKGKKIGAGGGRGEETVTELGGRGERVKHETLGGRRRGGEN